MFSWSCHFFLKLNIQQWFMYTGVHVELNFSLKEDKSKSELQSKLATSLGGGSWMNCIALPLGSLGPALEVYFAVG